MLCKAFEQGSKFRDRQIDLLIRSVDAKVKPEPFLIILANITPTFHLSKSE